MNPRIRIGPTSSDTLVSIEKHDILRLNLQNLYRGNIFSFNIGHRPLGA